MLENDYNSIMHTSLRQQLEYEISKGTKCLTACEAKAALHLVRIKGGRWLFMFETSLVFTFFHLMKHHLFVVIF